MSAGESLHRVSTVDALTEALRRQVLSGALGPGSQLREVELSTTYRVGRYSLRAALQRLAHEGLVRHEPNRGVFVPQLSADDVVDLFLLRTALETEAVRLLVERASPVDVAAAALREMEALDGDEPWDEVTELDLRFHRSLIEPLGSVRMTRNFASMQAELRLLLAQLQPQYDRPDKVGAEHRIVFDAVLGGDPQRAEHRMREHLERGVQDILRALAAGQAPPPRVRAS